MKLTLDNGIKVYIAHKKDLPITEIAFAVEAGGIYDFPGKEGLAYLMGHLLEKGTFKRTEDEIDNILEKAGIILDVNVGKHFIHISITSLSNHKETAIDILSDIVTNPIFPEKFVEREKEKVINEIKNELSDPNSVVEREFLKLVYGEEHPLGKPVNGFLTSIEKITRQDILEFYQKFLKPQRAYIAVVSDAQPSQILSLIKEYFSLWKAEEDSDGVSVPPPQFPTKPVLWVYHMPVNQVFIKFGHLAPLRNNPDYNKIRLMNYILGGGGFSSRVVKIVRAQKGYAYSVFTAFSFGYKFPGIFYGNTETKIETAHDAVKSFIQVIEDFLKEGATERELKDAKSFFEGSLPRLTETYRQIAKLMMDEMIYGLKEKFWVDDVEEIKRVTLKDIKEVTTKYLNPNSLVGVIVTDTTKFDIKKLNLPFDFEFKTPY